MSTAISWTLMNIRCCVCACYRSYVWSEHEKWPVSHCRLTSRSSVSSNLSESSITTANLTMYKHMHMVLGVMTLVQESILFTPSPNQHSTTRSVHLETVMHGCSARQGSAQTGSTEINTNKGSVCVCVCPIVIHDSKLVRVGMFFWWHKS